MHQAVAGARMLGMQDAVEHRIAQIDVARRHVDLGAQHARAVGELAGAHAAEQIEVLLDASGRGYGLFRPGSVSVPRIARISSGGLIVDIGLAGADQMLGPLVELLEIIRGVIEMRAPVEAEPAHVALDRVDIFLLFLGRVGVVEAQMAAPAELLRRRRNSGRSTWRGRYADSRSARAESA